MKKIPGQAQKWRALQKPDTRGLARESRASTENVIAALAMIIAADNDLLRDADGEMISGEEVQAAVDIVQGFIFRVSRETFQKAPQEDS